MAYRTILVHVDDSTHSDKRVEVAARIAAHEGSHLIGLGVAMPGETAEASTANRLHVAAVLEKFTDQVRAIGPASVETRLLQGDAADAVSAQGRFADLIVLGQGDAQATSLTARVDFPEYIVLNSDCPVLIVPCTGRVFSIGDRILLAWNGSAAALHATRRALTFLQQAKLVQLAILAPDPAVASAAEVPAAEIVDYLARQGVKVEVLRRDVVGDPGTALLALAADLTSDLIVMGCVAHPRARRVMLGGATRAVLEQACVPVLMGH